MSDQDKKIEEAKDWIDAQSYESLLREWLRAPVGDFKFTNKEVFEYYKAAMEKERDETFDNGVSASKFLMRGANA
jgi:hypothetical protein